MTRFLVDGKMVEVGELIEKAKKYDEVRECVPLVQHLAFEQVVKEYKTMQDILDKKLMLWELTISLIRRQLEEIEGEIARILQSFTPTMRNENE